MKVSFKFEKKEFSYQSPIPVGTRFLSKNTFLLTRIFADNIETSSIAFSSLQSFHHYPIENYQYILESVFSDHDIDYNHIQLERPYFQMIDAPVVDDELMYIIESVLFSLIEKFSPDILDVARGKKIKINGLYSQDFTVSENTETLKVKIRPTQESLHVTQELLEAHPDLHFRLDGNRTFSKLELGYFLSKLKTDNIEYVEEPFINHADFLNFKTVPLAMDESLLFYKDHLEKIPDNVFLILKPSLLGISNAYKIMQTYPGKCVISSTYEAQKTLRPLLFLAALNDKIPHGLDTLKFLPKNSELGTDLHSGNLSF